MRVLYDHQIFTTQKFGGISRFFLESMEYAKQNNLYDVEVGFSRTQNEYVAQSSFKDLYTEVPSANAAQFLPKLKFKGKTRFYNYLVDKGYKSDWKRENMRRSIEMIQAGAYDVLQPTYYDPYFIDVLPKGKPYVAYAYDLTAELFPELVDLSGTIQKQMRTALQRADKVIAISENTKKDVIDFYAVPSEKIEVVHLYTKIDVSKADKSVKLPEKYILFVGNRGSYKNFYFFLTAVAPLLASDPELHLVAAGGGIFNLTEQNFISNLGVKDKVVQISAETDEKLAACYAKAQMFVFPSLYEGFGLPVLEAFACNCPTLVSNTSCFSEIAGTAAVYFEPKSAPSILSAVMSVLKSEQKRDEMIAAGKQRVKDFSLEKFSRQVADIYRSLV